MPTYKQYQSCPAASDVPGCAMGGSAPFSGPPPGYTTRGPSSAYSEDEPTQWGYSDRAQCPLLPGSPSQSDAAVRVTWLRNLLTLVITFAITYFLFILFSVVFVPSQVALYKSLYDDARVQVGHLLKEKAALVNEVDGLREQLSRAKVEAFWEIARTMDTNMDVWVGADDPGADPKFWSYGIASGKYNGDNPPVTATQVHFNSSGATVVESTDKHRVVGYRVQSNRRNNGWWMATGLNEFGQSGYHRLQFNAKGAFLNGAEYEVVIFYAEWM